MTTERLRHKNSLASSPRPPQSCRMTGGWVYIVSNKRDGTIYVGVTADLRRRAYEHREGLVEGFSRTYGLKQLVYAEQHARIEDAIRREKTLKRWPRAWKVRLIHTINPDWTDLSETL